MSQSVDLVSQIGAAVVQLEALCAQAERAMGDLNWDELSATFAEQRRITHVLSVLLSKPELVLDGPTREEIDRRLRQIGVVRDGQLKRLETYHAEVGKRLTIVSRWKDASRTLGTHRPTSRLASLDLLR